MNPFFPVSLFYIFSDLSAGAQTVTGPCMWDSQPNLSSHIYENDAHHHRSDPTHMVIFTRQPEEEWS